MKKKETVLNKVCEFRKKNSLTQQNLAKAVGVSRQTIISIEKGNYTPSVSLAIKISKCLNKTVEDLFSLVLE